MSETGEFAIDGRPLRVLVATDAWHPQVNGVVRSLDAVAREAPALGAELCFLTPEGYRGFRMPTYPEIRLSVVSPGEIARRIEAEAPDHLHIATEGPIGLLARRHCLKRNLPFTTSYHTKFPEYVAARLPVPETLSYAMLRHFHNAAAGIMVSTASLEADLAGRGFRRLLRWSRGVDTTLFRPGRPRVLDLPRPISLFVGRVAVEKNIEAFLTLDLPGSKVVIGDGPARASLASRFPDVHFLGLREGEALADLYASADVFVFPSLTDTFGIVLLEALASGLPVAAFPVTGPLDVIGGKPVGALDMDLGAAVRQALTCSREACREHALRYSWRESAREFLGNVRRCMAPPSIYRKARIRSSVESEA
ncbi:MAG: glycosyltransferase family 1 protein [Beijerinckiaceae bacterium]|nr:glycosyltransferase family 1 protein [Beijerinckiaceae bacterium]